MHYRGKLGLLVSIVFIASIVSVTVQADVPTELSFQGILADSTGSPVPDGNYSTTFTIYDSDVGGNTKWTETQMVSTSNGTFAVLLGTTNPILDSVFNETPRYLGIQVGADPELTPRSKLAAVPFTQRTATVDGATGGHLKSSLVFSDSLAVFTDDPMMYIFETTPVSPLNKSILAHSPTLQSLKLAYNSFTETFYFAFGGPVFSIQMTSHKVGINTDSPDAELDVQGTLMAQGVSLGVNPTRSGFQSTIGGGGLNTVSANWATVAGGQQNDAGGVYSVVSGGHNNSAPGDYAIIPGGDSCQATGAHSFAAGRRALAQHDGAFVWADQTNDDFASSADGQFQIRATGGVNIYTDSALTSGVSLSAGGSSWGVVSDSSVKENVRPVNGDELLLKLSQLNISRWNYKSQDPSIEHIGPMAQDFYQLFGIGDNNTTINTVDPDGVSLAAIKALVEKNNKLEQEVLKLKELVGKLIENHNQQDM